MSSITADPLTEPAGGIGVLERPVLDPVDPGGHDRFSHYVAKGPLNEALVMGNPVEALCGKKWVPSRDPQRYPVCQDCKDKFESMPEGIQDPEQVGR